MPVFWLVILALWTALFFRLIGFRATLAPRTLLGYFALGLFGGPLALTLVAAFVNPYGWRGANDTSVAVLVAEINAVLAHVLLFAPVLAVLWQRGRYRALSVADAFLIAFLIGFGCDLANLLLLAAGADARIVGLAVLPPFELVANGVTLAGFAYWNGFVGLAFFAVLRFTRQPVFAYIVGGALLLWFATEHAVLTTPATDFTQTLQGLMFHGEATPWLALIALVALSWYELAWARSAATDEAQRELSPPTELQTLFAAVLSGKFAEAAQTAGVFRAQRRVGLLRAEARRSPDDASIRAALDLARADVAAEEGAKRTTDPMHWLRENAVPVAWWAAWAIVFLVLPRAPAANDAFWTLPVLQTVPPALNITVLAAALTLTLLWRYVTWPGLRQSFATIDQALQAGSLDLRLQSALGVVLILVFYSADAHFRQLLGALGNAPPLDAQKFAAFMLLLGCAVTASADPHAVETWAPAGTAHRLNQNNIFNLGIATFAAVIGSTFFDWTRAQMHAKLAASWYSRYGYNVQSLFDVLSSLLVFVLIFVVVFAVVAAGNWLRGRLTPSSVE